MNSVARSFFKAVVLLALAMAALPGSASPSDPHKAGDMWVRGGAWQVWPKGDNNAIVDVDDALGFGFNVTRMITDVIAVELLAAMPFKHDIRLKSTTTPVGSTQQLPPTLSVQYHPALNSAFKPYVGLGVNMTIFFDEEIDGAAGLGERLELDTVSVGPAVQIGLDYYFTDTQFLNLDVRYIDIETDAKIKGSGGTIDVGTVKIDPLAIGINFGWKF
jgi:outer membrane protein